MGIIPQLFFEHTVNIFLEVKKDQKWMCTGKTPVLPSTSKDGKGSQLKNLNLSLK
jgi:hypothetical protein